MNALENGRKKGLLALSPMVVFLSVYFATSIFIGDFYKVPVSAAFLIACVYSIIISKGTLKERIDIFSSGAGDHNALLMVWIFILSGAFAGTAKDIGAVDATVNLTLRIIPPRMVLVGLFLTACFISMAVGTSVGTIVALAPIAGGIASQAGCPTPYMAALIVGGALFGDNLSFISDTTIAATKALGCRMRDKFRVNVHIAVPAVIAVAIIYLLQGSGISFSAPDTGITDWYKILPYLIVIVLALMGKDVTVVLVCGILINAIIGFASGAFSWSGWLSSLGSGVSGMTDLIIVTLLAAGLLAMIKSGGGIDFLTGELSSRGSGRRSAQFRIAALVGITDLCTANNTIAIIMTGSFAREISDKAGLDPRKTASILDTFSCLVQGIIPYGAQVLMAAGLTGCSPTSMLPYMYYPFFLGLSAVLAIVFRFPRKYS